MHNLTRIIIGNWKMNGRLDFVNNFLQELVSIEAHNNLISTKVVICPPAPFLQAALQQSKNSPIAIGGQDCSSHEQDGAYTSQISASMLKDIGCKYVIVGHSETRKIQPHENIAHKLQAAQNSNLIPILCIGETLEEREQNKTEEILTKQLNDVTVANLDKPLIIAYEPIWAIGSNLSATTSDINHAASIISHNLDKKLGKFVSAEHKPVRIIYGGSVNSDNIKDVLLCDKIEGVLIGGASLELQRFWRVIRTCDQLITDKI
jgi:triosephosphate isomerase